MVFRKGPLLGTGHIPSESFLFSFRVRVLPLRGDFLSLLFLALFLFLAIKFFLSLKKKGLGSP